MAFARTAELGEGSKTEAVGGLGLDIAVGLAAELAATVVTGFAQQALYRLTPEDVREREDRVRPGPPPRLAAERISGWLGLHLSQKQTKAAAMALHYGLGMGWGPLYGLLRRHSGMRPFGAGMMTGAAMSLIVDEGVTPALGASAPSRDYPTATHVRGLLAHLAYGAVAALAAEALYRLAGTVPAPRSGRAASPHA